MKKSKHLRLAETQGELWCTDGLFAYNISSLPPLTPEQFIAIVLVLMSPQILVSIAQAEALDGIPALCDLHSIDAFIALDFVMARMIYII